MMKTMFSKTTVGMLALALTFLTKRIFISCLLAALSMGVCAANVYAGGSKDKSSAGSGIVSKDEVKPPPKAIPEDFPDEVKEALLKIRDTPDVLIGIGVGKHSSLTMSRTTATTRARADVARQMGVLVQTMVRSYQVTNEADQSVVTSYQEKTTTQLAKAALPGNGVIFEGQVEDGSYWVIVMFNKDEVKPGITEANLATKEDFPAMASFNVDDWYDQAFTVPIDEVFVANGR